MQRSILAILLWLGLLGWVSSIPRLPALPPPQTAVQLQAPAQAQPDGTTPTLVDFWEGRAEFGVDVADSGLPMGESDTLILADGEWVAYVHASQQSAGVVDQCGAPVSFPGCTVIYRSGDNGRSFQLNNPVCQFRCQQCPCDAVNDHTPQQQYPRVAYDPHGDQLWLTYEFRGHAMLRRSPDGFSWSRPQKVANSGLWDAAPSCRPEERINPHPFTTALTPYCLAGGPPGIFIEKDLIYIFVGLGQSPGHLGCYVGPRDAPPAHYRPCSANPLLRGASSYGPLDGGGKAAHPYWDFRMLSSAEVVKIGMEYYMLYEGIRGPGPGDGGDTQFGLGLARSLEGKINGRWEPYPGNPLLVDLPGNVGLGHADLIVSDGVTYLYTSLDGETRSRLRLAWK